MKRPTTMRRTVFTVYTQARAKGYSAADAWRAAVAIADGEDRDLRFFYEDDCEPYELGESETERPAYVLSLSVYRSEDLDNYGSPLRHARPLADIHGVGVDSPHDPFVQIYYQGELMAEALDVLDAEDAAEAATLASRATYAAGAS